MQPDEKRLFVTGLLVGLLLSRALRALLSTVFYESLATLRLNETAAWTLVLLAPALAPLARRHPRAWLAAGGLASAALGFARFTEAYVPLAALAVGALLAILPPRASGALLVGIALDAALLVLGRSHDPTLGLLGSIVVLLAGAALVKEGGRADGEGGLWKKEGGRGKGEEGRGVLAGVGFAVLLAVEWAFLASPFSAARWAGLPAWGAASASLVGLVFGATRLRRGGAWVWVPGVAGLLDVALFDSPLVGLSLALAQAALGAAGARMVPRLDTPGAAFGMAATLAPLLFLLLFFPGLLGPSEWGFTAPVLALAALVLGLPRPAPPRAPRTPSALAAALLLALLLAPAAMPAPLDAPPEGRELTVVTWNVHQGFGNRGALDPALYAQVLVRLDADVVLLQESDTARLSSGGLDVVAYLADALGMHAAYGRVGPAILSRQPFVDTTREIPLWSLETTIDVDGQRVAVRSVHFGRNTQEREAQAQTLVEMPPGPTIIAGDLNLFGGLAEGPYVALTARYQDAWTAAGHERDDPAGFTFRIPPEPRRRIDMVLVEGFEVLSAERVRDAETMAASDHLPVLARLRLSP